MKVHELLSDRSKWTRYAYGRTKDGALARAEGDAAVSWCLVGAMRRCYTFDERMPIYVRLKKAGILDVSGWNDQPDRTFADVRELVTRLDI